MGKYYYMESKYLRRNTYELCDIEYIKFSFADLMSWDSISIEENYKKKVLVEYTVESKFLFFEYDKTVLCEETVSDFPKYIIMNKIGDDYYEIFTKEKIVPDKNFQRGMGLYYPTQRRSEENDEVSSTYVPIFPISEIKNDDSKYFEDWNIETDENIRKLKLFVELAKVGMNCFRKEHARRSDIEKIVQNQKQKQKVNTINSFTNNLNRYGKK